jgi:hypothetical protein
MRTDQNPPRCYSLGISRGRIHRLYSFRQIGTGRHGWPVVLLTADCGAVLNMEDVSPHDIGPTCKRCKQLGRDD